jgi:hypothetical protein
MNYVISESRSPLSGYAPFWKPYGNLPRMTWDTALTSVDLLSLCMNPPWDTIIDVLVTLASNVNDGLPFDPSSAEPDLGMSMYFAAVCFRQEVETKLTRPNNRQALEAAKRCLDFCVLHHDEAKYWQHTYCDTVANALLITSRNR